MHMSCVYMIEILCEPIRSVHRVKWILFWLKINKIPCHKTHNAYFNACIHSIVHMILLNVIFIFALIIPYKWSVYFNCKFFNWIEKWILNAILLDSLHFFLIMNLAIFKLEWNLIFKMNWLFVICWRFDIWNMITSIILYQKF